MRGKKWMDRQNLQKSFAPFLKKKKNSPNLPSYFSPSMYLYFSFHTFSFAHLHSSFPSILLFLISNFLSLHLQLCSYFIFHFFSSARSLYFSLHLSHCLPLSFTHSCPFSVSLSMCPFFLSFSVSLPLTLSLLFCLSVSHFLSYTRFVPPFYHSCPFFFVFL